MAGLRPDAELQIEVLPGGRQRFALSCSGQQHQPNRIRSGLVRMLVQRIAETLDFFGRKPAVALLFAEISELPSQGLSFAPFPVFATFIILLKSARTRFA